MERSRYIGALVLLAIMLRPALAGPTISKSPSGLLSEVPRTAYFTLATRVRNNDNYTYYNVVATLNDTFNNNIFEFIESKKEMGAWSTINFTVALGTIGPGGEAIAVFKFKALAVYSGGEYINIHINSSTFSLNEQDQPQFTIFTMKRDKDSSFWRVPVSVNTMWSGRKTASARVTFPSNVTQGAVEVRDANYRKIPFESFNWTSTGSGVEATLVWGLNDSKGQPTPAMVKFYWVRYPIARENNSRAYTLELDSEYPGNIPDLPECITGGDDFEDEIDDNGSGWTKLHRWENDDVWEMDFVDSDLQPYGEDAHLGVDGAPLNVYCGHTLNTTVPRNLQLVRADRTSQLVHPSNVYLGDGNARYLALYTCEALNAGSWQDWGGTMHGLHLVLGFNQTVSTDRDFLKYWADYMVDDGLLDDPYTVWQSWKGSCFWVYGSGKYVRVLYKNDTCLGDYLEGQGTSCTNPVGYGTATVSWYECSTWPWWW